MKEVRKRTHRLYISIIKQNANDKAQRKRTHTIYSNKYAKYKRKGWSIKMEYNFII